MAPTGTNTHNFNIIDGKIDVNNDAVINGSDDGTLWFDANSNNLYDTSLSIIDGSIDTNASGTITIADDATLNTGGGFPGSTGNNAFLYYNLRIAEDVTGTTGASQHSTSAGCGSARRCCH